MQIAVALLVFGLVILVHEFGHFIIARKNGVLVEEFAIGMGPKIFGIKRGETLYTLRAIPMGGFCRMYGDDADPMDKEDETLDHNALSDRALNGKTVLQRIAVMAGGSLFNFAFAFILFILMAFATGVNTTIISSVSADLPAQAAGIQEGDRITHLNGRRIFLWDDILLEMTLSQGEPITLGFTRDGMAQNVVITPASDGTRFLLGISSVPRSGFFTPAFADFERVSLGEAATDGFMRMGFMVRMVGTTLFRLVTSPGTVVDQLAGPVGIVNMMGGQYQAVVAAAGNLEISTLMVILSVILTMLNFAAIISVNLGVMNLLPIPALDGGRILFLIVEGIRRKPIPPERENIIHLAGFVLLIALMLLITYQDILNLL